MAFCVGLDIGGSKFLVAAADEKGKIIARVKHSTPHDLDEGIELLHDMIAKVAGEGPLIGMGAAIGGPLDWEAGVVSPLHQPQWRDVPLKAIMEERWHCPFFVDVDTNAAALGEFTFGDENAERFLYMTVSTGIGGGFLLDGRIYRGMKSGHPEVGHQSIPYRCRYPERVECECGAQGCLEALVSGNGIRRIYGKPAENLHPDEWQEVAYNLGQGLRNIAAICLPDIIVLGGGVAVGGGNQFIDQARKVMADNLKIVPTPQVRLSRLGYETALLGSIALALHGFEPQPL
ncbi:ROK family protein [candidate division KSB1 bacterium]|nr:ROK family protein [candidate division KSB1 bacterium]